MVRRTSNAFSGLRSTRNFGLSGSRSHKRMAVSRVVREHSRTKRRHGVKLTLPTGMDHVCGRISQATPKKKKKIGFFYEMILKG